jgi:uncharacterized protein (TIGR02594 family)
MKTTMQPTDPAWLKEAFSHLGLKEGPGAKNNKEVLEFYADAGHAWVTEDSVAWCAAFVGACLVRAGLPGTKSLAARSYLDWGKKTDSPKRGDIVVFSRGTGWQGHVAFFLGTENGYVWHLGGNQSDAVTVTRSPGSRVLGFRTPVTLKNSRTIKAQAVTGMGAVVAGAGETARQAASMASESANHLTEAGAVVQGLGAISPWFFLAGAVLVLGGIGWTAYSRYTDWHEKAK